MVNDQIQILVVDDSKTMRDIYCQIFEEKKIKILQAGTGEEALEIINASKHIDAIILDIEMPGIDGFETCKRIRATHLGQYVPILISTGFDDLESINKAYDSGATDFVTKPVNWDVLPNRMQYMIRNGQNLQLLAQNKEELLESQESIKKLNESLEKRVVERTKDLQEANTELSNTLTKLQETQHQLIESEKMASLGNLVTGIAHEVNTPLGISYATVTNFNDKLKTLQASAEKQQLTRTEFANFINLGKESCELMIINLKHAIELIRSFKEVSVDQASETLSRFNVKDYFNEIIFSLKPLINKNNLKVTIDCPNDLVINSYPGVFFHLTSILINNTINHGYEKGQAGEVYIAFSTDNKKVTYTYSDKGKGIAEENIQKIFDPFFTTKRSSGNTGLGLHIAYNQVTKILGGTIVCESQLGAGSKFIITFPLGTQGTSTTHRDAS